MGAKNHTHMPASPGRRRLLQSALAGTLGMSLAACGGDDDSGSVDYSATIQDGRAAIQRAMDESKTSSVSVALVDGDRMVWQQAFGMADQAGGKPADVNTLYNIGSVSKVFATAAIMLLVDRGQVDLDAPAASYVHDFHMLSPGYARITVRMLLSHSSGFPGSNYNNSFTFQPVPGYARRTQSVLADEHLKHEPGELAVYCNDGFTMAERVVEEVSGKSYAAFVQQEILGPLSMTLTRYPLSHYPAGSFAHPYADGKELGQEFVNVYGSGGLSSTPTEMMNLAMMFMNQGEYKGRRILSRAAVQQMGTDQTTGLALNPTPVWKWGLGWDQVDHPGLRSVGFTCWQKNGGTAYFGSDFFVLPEVGLALMITGTSLSYGSAVLAERILLHALVDKHRLAGMPQKLSATPPPVAPDGSADLSGIQGYYGSFEGVSKVVPNGSDAVDLLRYVNGAWTMVASGLQLRTDGWFASDQSPRSFRIEDIGSYRYLSSRFVTGYGHYLGGLPYGERIQAESPISPAWRARIGQSWVLVNEHESSTSLVSDSPRVTLSEIPDLPGYVQIDGRQPLLPDTDLRTRQFLKIPVIMGRDLYELVVRQPDGAAEWLWFGGYLYRPLSSIPSVSAGTRAVQFDAEGNSECLLLEHCSAVTVSGARAWRLYDDQWKVVQFVEGPGSATFSAANRYYLMVYGEATSQAQLVLA
ncbi:serine hydrolase domain-containing protein [Candidimonas nitroreducens]|uniref:Serine hydrolase n=1 Tax=Candidimonas nitroreducens TaxID=683354 RepID=A0A225MBN2_9BURK|nr:serine hydrolase domain-containing protein [Candidimonas nitroreducens]OWT57550.1 serine hydrolase [Candidimonas nitroreducens]